MESAGLKQLRRQLVEMGEDIDGVRGQYIPSGSLTRAKALRHLRLIERHLTLVEELLDPLSEPQKRSRKIPEKGQKR